MGTASQNDLQMVGFPHMLVGEIRMRFLWFIFASLRLAIYCVILECLVCLVKDLQECFVMCIATRNARWMRQFWVSGAFEANDLQQIHEIFWFPIVQD